MYFFRPPGISNPQTAPIRLANFVSQFVHNGSFCHGNMAPRIASCMKGSGQICFILLLRFSSINLTAMRQSCACHIQQLLIATRRLYRFFCNITISLELPCRNPPNGIAKCQDSSPLPMGQMAFTRIGCLTPI